MFFMSKRWIICLWVGLKKMLKPNQTEKSGFCSYFGVWFDLIFVLLSFRQIMRFAQVLFACVFLNAVVVVGNEMLN
jgi:hypothetical protein